SLDFTVAVPALTGPNGTIGTVVPAFTWNGVGGVTQYEVYVSDLTTGQVQDLTVSGTTWTPTTPLVSGHSYRWWARGNAGIWSSSMDFKVAVPTLIGPAGTVGTGAPTFTWNGLS